MISASVIIANTTDSRFRSSRLWGVAYEVTGARALLRQILCRYAVLPCQVGSPTN